MFSAGSITTCPRRPHQALEDSFNGGACLLPRNRIVKLVRALRKGWIRRDRRETAQEPATYLLWEDDLQTADKTQSGACPAFAITSAGI